MAAVRGVATVCLSQCSSVIIPLDVSKTERAQVLFDKRNIAARERSALFTPSKGSSRIVQRDGMKPKKGLATINCQPPSFYVEC